MFNLISFACKIWSGPVLLSIWARPGQFFVSILSGSHWAGSYYHTVPESRSGRPDLLSGREGKVDRRWISIFWHFSKVDRKSREAWSHNGTELDVQSHRHARQVLWSLTRHSPYSKPIQRKPQKKRRGRRSCHLFCGCGRRPPPLYIGFE